MKKNKLKWEFSAGFYPGLLMGMRSYKDTNNLKKRIMGKCGR